MHYPVVDGSQLYLEILPVLPESAASAPDNKKSDTKQTGGTGTGTVTGTGTGTGELDSLLGGGGEDGLSEDVDDPEMRATAASALSGIDDIPFELVGRPTPKSKSSKGSNTKPKQKSIIMELFDREKNLIVMKYNKPLAANASSTTTVIYDQSLSIDKTLTLFALKEMIAKAISVPVENFRIARPGLSGAWSSFDTWEIKSEELADPIALKLQHDNNNITVKLGRSGEYKTEFKFFDPSKEFPLRLAFDLPVHGDMKVADLYPTVSAKLKEKKIGTPHICCFSCLMCAISNAVPAR